MKTHRNARCWRFKGPPGWEPCMACLVLDNAAVRGAVGVDGRAGLRRAVLGARSPQGGVEDRSRLPDLPLWAKLSSTSPVFRTASTRGAAVGQTARLTPEAQSPPP